MTKAMPTGWVKTVNKQANVLIRLSAWLTRYYIFHYIRNKRFTNPMILHDQSAIIPGLKLGTELSRDRADHSLLL